MNKPIAWRNHLPGLFLIVAVMGVLWLGSPWPESVANGWDAQGRPIHWQWTPANLGVAITIWLVWFGMDGLWGMVERARRIFNPLSLVDEGLLGWMLIRIAGAAVANGAPPSLRGAAWVLAVLAVSAAVGLEVRRLGEQDQEEPAHVPQDTTTLAREMEHARASGQRWSYWSVQRPPHPALFATLGAAFLVGSVAIPDSGLFPRLVLVAGGAVVFLVCAGGLRTVVTPERLLLRAGWFGPRLLRLDTSDIVRVAVPSFDPMRDFWGFGIRRGVSGPLTGVRAFNLADAGVLVETRAGRRYLIGADDPERLAAALEAARGKTLT
jgi:hypothetical protein